MSQNHQKHINKYFPNRPIAYQPGLALVLSSVNASILFFQLLYWHEKGNRKDGWIYKTMHELKDETGLTRTQQESAIKICRKYELFDYKLAGIPAKRHFKINLEILENILPSLKKKAGVVFMNPPYKFAGNMQSTTEITHMTTTENTNRKLKSSSSSLQRIMNDRYGKTI